MKNCPIWSPWLEWSGLALPDHKKSIFKCCNQEKLSASLCCQVAALFADMFCSFNLVKNHKIDYNDQPLKPDKK
jgi:hypothetical protein